MVVITEEISQAITVLNNDDIIGFPTETVYGLAGNIYSEKAIAKIFDIKKRPAFNPLIVHIKDVIALNKIAKNVPEKAMLLASKFWPGPLTLLLEKKSTIPDVITAGKPTVAVRIPNHLLALELLRAVDFPLAAPSANPFGRISPTTAQHVANYFQDDLKLVLDGGDCHNGLESTIVGFDDFGEAVIYRLGAISTEDIEGVVGKTTLRNKNEKSPEAPGMIGKHYSPRTKTMFLNAIDLKSDEFKNVKIGALTFCTKLESEHIVHSEILSAKADLAEAAKNLYQALHQLDAMNLDLILVEKMQNKGLGLAINDRLKRATNH